MMLVHAISFHLPALQALEGAGKLAPQFLGGDLARLRLDVSPSAERLPAGFAFGDGIVGVVIGQFEDGPPTFQALKTDGNLIVPVSSACASGAGMKADGSAEATRRHNHSAGGGQANG